MCVCDLIYKYTMPLRLKHVANCTNKKMIVAVIESLFDVSFVNTECLNVVRDRN